MGMGQLARSCKELKRNFIGIDINKELCDNIRDYLKK